MTISEETKQNLRKMLLDMRQESLDRVRTQHQIERERDHVGDLGDYTVSEMAAEYACMLRERLRERILSIDEALDAIEDGDYGICEECEEAISEKRLLLMPFARMCVRCQSELERQAKLRGEIIIESSVYSKAV